MELVERKSCFKERLSSLFEVQAGIILLHKGSVSLRGYPYALIAVAEYVIVHLHASVGVVGSPLQPG